MFRVQFNYSTPVDSPMGKVHDSLSVCRDVENFSLLIVDGWRINIDEEGLWIFAPSTNPSCPGLWVDNVVKLPWPEKVKDGT